jgi:uncharacterized protein YecE (DUF72 family)
MRRWLAIAAETFGALEINGSFYTQISPATYERWRAETPADHVFTLKGHRYVTHYKRLRDCAPSIALLRGQAKHLGDKLAAVVWQLPSNLRVDVARLAAFCDALSTEWPETRHALELRHRSWFTDEVARVLADARVAVCMGDAPDFPMWRAVTTDLVYIRLHGHTRKYASSYSRGSLERWAADARGWAAEGRDVHIYFDNDAEGHAVRNALDLKLLLDGRSPPSRRSATRSAHRVSGSSRASPWRPRTSPHAARSPSARRSTART